METVKTNPEVVIPSTISYYVIRSITIEPDTRVSKVEVNVKDGYDSKIFVADVSQEWSKVSATNKTIIKAFLKKTC